MYIYYKTTDQNVIDAFKSVQTSCTALKAATAEYAKKVSAKLWTCKAVNFYRHDRIGFYGLSFDDLTDPCFCKKDAKTGIQNLRVSVAKKHKIDHASYKNTLDDCKQGLNLDDVSFCPIFEAIDINPHLITITGNGWILPQCEALRFGLTADDVFYFHCSGVVVRTDKFHLIFDEITGTEHANLKNGVKNEGK